MNLKGRDFLKLLDFTPEQMMDELENPCIGTGKYLERL